MHKLVNVNKKIHTFTRWLIGDKNYAVTDRKGRPSWKSRGRHCSTLVSLNPQLNQKQLKSFVIQISNPRRRQTIRRTTGTSQWRRRFRQHGEHSEAYEMPGFWSYSVECRKLTRKMTTSWDHLLLVVVKEPCLSWPMWRRSLGGSSKSSNWLVAVHRATKGWNPRVDPARVYESCAFWKYLLEERAIVGGLLEGKVMVLRNEPVRRRQLTDDKLTDSRLL